MTSRKRLPDWFREYKHSPRKQATIVMSEWAFKLAAHCVNLVDSTESVVAGSSDEDIDRKQGLDEANYIFHQMIRQAGDNDD